MLTWSIVYDPRRHDNELRSIEEFEEYCSECPVSERIKSQVTELIRATIKHQLPPEADINIASTFLDLDLEVLSWPWDEYLFYTNQIRLEYAHYSDEDYKVGRRKVMKSFLDRPRVYFSASFENLELRARENISNEIKRLL